MAIDLKAVVVGPAALSFSGSDLGCIKTDSIEWDTEKDEVFIGDNEQLAGYSAKHKRIKKHTLKCVLEQVSLENIKMTLGLTGAITGTTTRTLPMEFESGMEVSGTLIMTCAAPRTTAGLAQVRTVTGTAVPSGAWKYKPGVGGKNTIACEFTFLYVDGSGDLKIEDANA